MEEQVLALLSALKKPNTVVNQKIELFNTVKSGVKHTRVPDGCQAPLLECIRLAISPSSPSAQLVSAGLSTLRALIRRLALQDRSGLILSQLPRLLPSLLEHLGDKSETIRQYASYDLGDLWPFAHEQIETLIRDDAMKSTSPRAKEAAMQWVVQVRHAVPA
jgi:CLIP-associating protein 1/2